MTPAPLIWRNGARAGDATLGSSAIAPATAMRPHRIPASSACTIAALALALGTVGAHAADLARGRALYELRCDACHTESVHGRAHRVAKSLAEVRQWVSRWNRSLAIGWSDAEIDDVAAYLNATYYKFDCTTPACAAVSLAHSPAAR